MAAVWESQKRHVACIQDPDLPDLSLYAVTGSVKKAGISLPTYRCARESTSLESFHLHLARFIPGSTASDVHFQAFLLDGLVRWNEDRARQATNVDAASGYSGVLRHNVNTLCEQVFGERLVPEYRVPRRYTGELLVVEYLYNQTGKSLQVLAPTGEEEDKEDEDEEELIAEDEGFDEIDVAGVDDPTIPEVPVVKAPTTPRQKRASRTSSHTVAPASPPGLSAPGSSPTGSSTTASPPTTDDSVPTSPEPPEPGVENLEAVGPDNIGGFLQVDMLAAYLSRLRKQTLALTNDQAAHIVQLWRNLSDYDKKPTVREPVAKTTQPLTGRFKAKSPSNVTAGVEATKRCFLGQNTGPAARPDSNRLMELLVIKLCSAHPSPVKRQGKTLQRWNLVSGDYKTIRELVLNCATVMTQTRITLLELNIRTITAWYNKCEKDNERRMLEQGLVCQSHPCPRLHAFLCLGGGLTLNSDIAPVPVQQQHRFELPAIRLGQAINRQFPKSAVASPPNPESELYLHQATATQHHAPTILIKPMYQQQQQPTLLPMSPPERPRSTSWYQKKVIKKQAAGEQVVKNVRRLEVHTYTCSKCKQLRSSDTHTQYYGSWYCATTATESLEEWRASKKKCRDEKKATPKPDT